MKKMVTLLMTITTIIVAGSAQPIFEYVNAPDEAHGWEQSGTAKTGENDRLLLFPMAKTRCGQWMSLTLSNEVTPSVAG